MLKLEKINPFFGGDGGDFLHMKARRSIYTVQLLSVSQLFELDIVVELH